ncbi:MAG TPA: response regulator [Longimicrobiales bacterium]
MNREDLSGRLLRLFTGEIEEHVGSMNADLLALEKAPGDGERLRSLFRSVHTLKGAARAAGVRPLEALCHAWEEVLVELREGRAALDPSQMPLHFAAVDAIETAGKALRKAGAVDSAALARLTAAFRRTPADAAGSDAAAAMAQGAVDVQRVGAEESPEAPRPGGEALAVRVPVERLDRLAAAGGRLLAARSRVAEHARAIEELRELSARWAADWRRQAPRVRAALAKADVPAEVARSVAGVDGQLRALLAAADRLTAETRRDARGVSRAADDITDGVRRLRMRPFRDACAALPRTVRDLAAGADKEVRLEIGGNEVEADRGVLDAIREALLHLVRNAVDHGIEPKAERERAGKDGVGTVRVAATIRGERIEVAVIDDGRGLDMAAIQRQLARRGVEIPDAEEDQVRALFRGGLSTAPEATAISGRGVGLDAVRAAMERVGGRVDVRWQSGAGTTFLLDCPVSLATVRALQVEVGGRSVALPLDAIERVIRIRPADLRRSGGRTMVPAPDGLVPVVPLAAVLGPGFGDPAAASSHAVIVAVPGARIALAVDRVEGDDTLAVRPLGRRARGLATGCAVLGTNRIALVLDASRVAARGLERAAAGDDALLEGGAMPARARRRILVVDDSITARTLEVGILQTAGYDVVAAADGDEALRRLRGEAFDLVVADVEMPRMDGFALCRAIRADDRLAALPVVLVTALEAPEQRRRGLEAGADAYLGKSGFERAEFLATIRDILAER